MGALTKDERRTVLDHVGLPHALLQVDAAMCLGITPQALCGPSWKGCPRNQDGTYDLPAVIRWRIEQIEMAYRNETADRDEIDREIRATKLERDRLELERLKGTLVSIDEVKRQFGIMCERFKQVVLRVPSALSQSLEGRSRIEIHGELDAAMRQALEEIRELTLDPSDNSRRSVMIDEIAPTEDAAPVVSGSRGQRGGSKKGGIRRKPKTKAKVKAKR